LYWAKGEEKDVCETEEIDEKLFPVLKTHPVIQAAAPVVEFQASLKSWPGQTIWIMGVDFGKGGA